MPTPYPEEFRRDVIAVARQGDQSIAKVAKSFGISETCLARWLRIAERQDGQSEGPSPGAEGDLVALIALTMKVCEGPAVCRSWARRYAVTARG